MPRSAPPVQWDPLSGIDFSFRPKTYFWPLPLATHLLAQIKGAERKVALQELIAAGRLHEVSAFLTTASLNDAERAAVGRLHPAFMGGEYLPDLQPNEVEIARITIASTTQDVTSIYARRGKRRIYYRVVDDYEGETLAEKRTRTSRQPLTLSQLEAFFNQAWSIFDVLEMNFGDCGYDVDRMLNFVVGVESSFYPELETLYTRRIAAWAAQRQAELNSDYGQ